jgi:probable phosphoglycerate mutase
MSVTTELVIVRHTEANCNVDGVLGGEAGCRGLTEAGVRQAHTVAMRLGTEHARAPFDLFYTGPRLRVRQTAEVIAARVGLTPTVVADLRGPDHGAGDGLPLDAVRDAFGGNPRRYPDRRYALGSETWREYLHRASTAILRLLDRADGRRVLVAGHRETVEATHFLLLGLAPESCTFLRFDMGFGCLARWRRHHDRHGHITWQLIAHNDGAHFNAVG